MTAAAQCAHVGRGTSYYWLERYAAAGEAGLAEPRSCAPLSAAVCAEVLAYYDAHPHERGCRTLAERLRQAPAGQAVLGHSKVAEILRLARPASRNPAPAAADAPAVGAATVPPAAAAAPVVAAVHAPGTGIL